jgi:rubredoxin
MKTKYVCQLCGYEYNPRLGDVDNDIEPGTDFEDISSDWTCPLCGAGKDDFECVEVDDDNDEDYE